MSAATSETRPLALLPPPCGCSWLTGTPPLLGHSNKTYLGRKLVVWKAEERKRFTNQPLHISAERGGSDGATPVWLGTWAVEAPGCGLCGQFVECRSDRDVAETSHYWSETQDTAAERGWEEALEEKMTVIKDKETQLTFNNRDANRKNLLRRCGSVYPQIDRKSINLTWNAVFPAATLSFEEFLKANLNEKSECRITEQLSSLSPWQCLIACWNMADWKSIRVFPASNACFLLHLLLLV